VVLGLGSGSGVGVGTGLGADDVAGDDGGGVVDGGGVLAGALAGVEAGPGVDDVRVGEVVGTCEVRVLPGTAAELTGDTAERIPWLDAVVTGLSGEADGVEDGRAGAGEGLVSCS
jgi:hypothetical protein